MSLFKEVRNQLLIGKRTTSQRSSDSSAGDNSPKGLPLGFPADTPEWVQVLFNKLELSLSQAVEYATDTAISALTEAGCNKKTIQDHELELSNIHNQLAQVKSEVQFFRDKLAKLEDQARCNNLLF